MIEQLPKYFIMNTSISFIQVKNVQRAGKFKEVQAKKSHEIK